MKYSDIQNKYYIMRHGESKANQEGIIISSPENGISDYGLTSSGINEVNNTLNKTDIKSIDIIYSSDFKRTNETARLAADFFSVEEVINAIELRERFFGKYELTSTENYKKIWELDNLNPESYPDGVESTENVKKRTISLINKLEKKYKNKKILLVAHGDVLQILFAAMQDVPSCRHRTVVYIKTAEIRPLIPSRF